MNRTLLLRDIWLFLRTTRRLWMLPMILALVLLGGLLALAETSALAPFIYTIF
jgi:hypothetical protein